MPGRRGPIILYVLFFQYNEPVYKGFISEVFAAPDFTKDTLPHNPYKCLECSIALNKARHRSTSDLSTSNENLAYAHQHASSNSSLSPFLRSHSHTSESPTSSMGSSGHSHTSPQSGRKEVAVLKAGQATVNGDDRLNNGDEPDKRGKPKSPLLRMKRVTSEGTDISQTPATEGGGGDSSSKASSGGLELLSPGGSSGAGSSVSGREEGEEEEEEAARGSPSPKPERKAESDETKAGQEVMIHVIKPRYVAFYVCQFENFDVIS